MLHFTCLGTSLCKSARKVPVISNKSIFILIIHYKVVALVLGSAYLRGVHV